MTPKKYNLYHLFIVLSVFNLLTYYLFVGHSLLGLNEKKGFFNDEQFNYFLAISIIIMTIWLTYFLLRKRTNSNVLTLFHLSVTFITILAVPWIRFKFPPQPGRYFVFDNGVKLSDLFGNMTWAFIIAGVLLLTSELFLIINISKKHADNFQHRDVKDNNSQAYRS